MANSQRFLSGLFQRAGRPLSAFPSAPGGGALPLLLLGTLGIATVGQPFNFVPLASGGAGPRAYSLVGSLPAGLTFSPITGAISGTPSAGAATDGLAIRVADSTGTVTLALPTLLVASTAEAAAYFGRMTTKPAAAVLSILDTMISTVRASTGWAKTDGFHFLAQDTYQAGLLNIMGPHPLRVTGSPIFTARAGVAGAAGASLTNGVVLTEGTLPNLSLNSVHIGAYIASASSSTTAIIGTDAGFTLQLLPRSASGNAGMKLNDNTTAAAAVPARTGHFCASRTGASAKALYRNGGAAIASTTTAPTALPASPLYLFRDDTNYATDTVSAFHFGAGLTQAENQVFCDAITTATNAIAALGPAPSPSAADFDVVIYGGTLAGLMAAQRAANYGARVAIVEPTAELGGVGHHGLTYFDLALRGAYQVMNASTMAFFVAVNKAYVAARTTPAQVAEPKVYDQIFASILAATRATTFLSSPLVSSADVQKVGKAISAIRTANGWITGRQFIDASYEMDLAACAGAPYQVGREGQAAYGEPDAGFFARRIADGGFNFSMDGVTPNNLYPVKAKPVRADGAADNLIQPISYRFPITTASNRLPFPAPPGGYVSSKMDQVVAGLLAKNVQTLGSVLYIGGDTAVQNSKFIINNSQNNIFPSLELSGAQMGYPDGTPAQRQAILADVRSWTLHLLYCLQNDPRLPAALRNDAALYGLCADEFVNNSIPGFPNFPYIREARRLKGKYVMTQFDTYSVSNPLNTTNGARTNLKSNRVAQQNYIQDSHAMELYADGASSIVITGNAQHTEVDTYDIPFSALHTDPNSAGHVSNLTVPLCYSSTSVGWMSGRLEPNFASLGEAAGLAAMIAAEDGIDISAVPYNKLSRRLGSPINTDLPTITGTAQVNQTLDGGDGTWLFSPKGYTYAWRSGVTALATTRTYTPASGDAGKLVTRTVYANNGMSVAQATSAPVLIAAAS